MGCGFLLGGRAKALLPGMLSFLLSLLPACISANPASVAPNAAAADPFTCPTGLRPQVEFWIEVFARLRQNEVLLHDERYLGVRYEVITLPGTVEDGLNREQLAYLKARKDQLGSRLESLGRKIGHGETLTPAEQELKQLLESAGAAAAIGDAAHRLRAQRGLRERFIAGVRRSGRYIGEMQRIITGENLPADLALLPHVESSFNIDARSTAGAAGIWQFTRATGRRFLHISDALDERLDPFTATRAASVYLRTAHEVLGDWALAITSYNHGITGMLRASQQFGPDIEHIIREYDSDSFGFASRNFYTEFLAVREILDHPEQYFQEPLRFDAPAQLVSLVLPRPTSAPRLARILDTDVERLAETNPAWLEKALLGKVALPTNATVWLPIGIQVKDETVTAQLYLAERNVPPLPVLDGQARKQLYRVRRGDTLGTIASREGVSLAALRELNGIQPNSHHIRIGQNLKLPAERSAARRATASTKTKPEVHLVRNGENPFVIARRYKVPLSSLLAENGLVQDAIIHPGQRLRIPSATKP